MSQTYRIALYSIVNILRYVIEAVVMFAITSKMVRSLGVDDFGLWLLVFSVVGFFILLDFGFMTGVVKYTSESKGRGDIERRNRLISTLAVVYIAIGLIAATGIGILSVFFDSLFSIPEPQRIKTQYLLWIVSARAVILYLPFSLFAGLLFGEQRIVELNGVKCFSSLLYGVLAWLLLDSGYGVLALAGLNLLDMLVEHSLYVLMSFRYIPHLRLSWSRVDWKIFREVSSFSAYQFVINLSVLVLTRTDPVIIKLFLPLSAVASYSVSMKIAETIRLLIKQFINVFTPIIGELHGARNQDSIRSLFLYGTQYALAMAMALAIPTWIFGRELIVFWVGPDLAQTYPVLCILTFISVILIPHLMASNVLAMTDHYRFTAVAAIASIAINIGFTLILVVPLGLVGVALGTLIATSSIDVALILHKTFRELQLPFSRFYRAAIQPVLLPGIGQGLFLLAIQRWYPPANIGWLVLVNIPGLLLYVLVYGLASLELGERERILHKFKRNDGKIVTASKAIDTKETKSK